MVHQRRGVSSRTQQRWTPLERQHGLEGAEARRATSQNFKTPIMLTIGEKDYRVPLNQTLAAWTYLQRMKVPSKLLVFHQANHWIMSGPDAKHFWSEVHAWLDQHLKVDKP